MFRLPAAGPASLVRSHPLHTRLADAMGTFVVEGGHRLDGRIRPAGNKNAALPCLAATVLAREPVTLDNVPRIRDVETFLEIVSSMGASVEWNGPNEVTIDASGVETGAIDGELARVIRASVLLAGPMLARFGHVRLPPPGGDIIGRRRMDTHFLAFEALGAHVALDTGFTIEADRLRGDRSLPGRAVRHGHRERRHGSGVCGG